MSERVFNIVRDPRNGNLVCSGMCDQGYLETKVYIGYSKAQARKLFREYLKSINAQWLIVLSLDTLGERAVDY